MDKTSLRKQLETFLHQTQLLHDLKACLNGGKRALGDKATLECPYRHSNAYSYRAPCRVITLVEAMWMKGFDCYLK